RRTTRSTSVKVSSHAIWMGGGAQRDESQGRRRWNKGEAVEAQDPERIIRVRDVPGRRRRSAGDRLRGGKDRAPLSPSRYRGPSRDAEEAGRLDVARQRG